jgi:hypothetical protein
MSPADFNFNESESSTEWFLSEVLESGITFGQDALTAPVALAGLPAVAISQNAWTASAVAPVQE